MVVVEEEVVVCVAPVAVVVVEVVVVTLVEFVAVVLVEVTVVTLRGRWGFVRTVVQIRRWWRRWQTRTCLLVCASPRLAAASGETASAPTASSTTRRVK